MNHGTLSIRRSPQALQLKLRTTGKQKQSCNLCKEHFVARTKFQRFCHSCRQHSQLYHFAEWMQAS